MSPGQRHASGVPNDRGTGAPGIDAETRALLLPLWDFLAVSHAPKTADVIFVFGSGDLAVPDRAAELYHAGYAPRLLVSGRAGRRTRGVFTKPEALVFKDRLVAAGVPASAVLAEPSAGNTLENVRFGMTLMQQAGWRVSRALLVAKGFAMRRCLATFQRQFASVEIRGCPPTGGLDAALDRPAPELAVRLAAEIARLDRYAARDEISVQAVPSRVRRAAQAVRARYPKTTEL